MPPSDVGLEALSGRCTWASPGRGPVCFNPRGGRRSPPVWGWPTALHRSQHVTKRIELCFSTQKLG